MGAGSFNRHRKFFQAKREEYLNELLDVETAPPMKTERRPLADDEGEIAEPKKPKPGWRKAQQGAWRSKGQ